MSSGWPPPGIDPVDYEPQVVSSEELSRRFALVQRTLIEHAPDGVRASPNWSAMQRTFADGSPIALYQHGVGLVARFIGAELDTTTPGTRGLGRLAPTPPRLGGRFRGELKQPATQRALALAAEATIVAGFAAAVFTLHFLKNGPVTAVARTEQELWTRWVPRAYAGLRGVAALQVGTASAQELFVATAVEHGLVGRLRPAKKMSLQLVAAFYASAGAALYEVSTDLSERQGAQHRSLP